MTEEQTVPTDVDHDVTDSGVNEEAMLADILQNSPMAEVLGIEESPPDAEVPHPDESTDVEEEDLEEVDESAVETDDEEVDEAEEEYEEDEDASEDATQEAAVYDLDELDDFQVNVKVDGETVPVDIKELVKGYATDQHLSKQGRELGELKKEIEAERNEKLAEVAQLSQVLNQSMMGPETSLAQEYKSLDEQIKKAEAEGDDYEVNQLTSKQSRVQKKYWEARKQREGMLQAAAAQQQKAEQEAFARRVQHFHETIEQIIPDFDEEMAQKNAEFAMSKGIPEEMINQITDPIIVKFIDDFRRSEETKTAGSVKRKKATVKKAVPAKKPRTQAQKKQTEKLNARNKALAGSASKDEELDFLKSISKFQG